LVDDPQRDETKQKNKRKKLPKKTEKRIGKEKSGQGKGTVGLAEEGQK